MNIDTTSRYIYYYLDLSYESKHLSDAELFIKKRNIWLKKCRTPNTPKPSSHQLNKAALFAKDIVANRKDDIELKSRIVTDATLYTVIKEVEKLPHFIEWWPDYPKPVTDVQGNRKNEVW